MRVTKCHSCGGRLVAGARGPLPTLHPDCRPPGEQLLYQVRSAARLAHTIGRQTVGFELDAIAAVLLTGRSSESPPSVPTPPVDGPPPSPAPSAAEWTRLGE